MELSLSFENDSKCSLRDDAEAQDRTGGCKGGREKGWRWREGVRETDGEGRDKVRGYD